MYKLEYLPIALADMVEIIRYIKEKLQNTTAAESISNEFVQSAEQLKDFPYSNPLHYPIEPLKREYRKLYVKNYIMFYYVDESKKCVTIARVIYAKRNYVEILG